MKDLHHLQPPVRLAMVTIFLCLYNSLCNIELFLTGVSFGDPSSQLPGKKVFIEELSPTVTLQAENVSTTPQKLAMNLLTSLFLHEELVNGNCTKATREDIVLLDQKKIQAIRGWPKLC